MQAVRLARYHTRRSHLVRFCGAYHGWWGDVQPGIGNPVPAHETYTLKDMSEDTLRVLRNAPRHRLRAGQPVAGAASQRQRRRPIPRCSTAARRAHFDRDAYAAWLKELRAVCTERGIVLIFDEVFVGFRLARAARRNISACAPTRHLRQDAGRRPADRRGLRPARTDEALSRRPPRRHLLRPRHVQFAPLRHGRDERVPAAPGHPGGRPLYHDLDGTWNGGRSGSTRGCAPRACRWRSPICRRSGRSATRGRRAIIGCFNIICGPKAWR